MDDHLVEQTWRNGRVVSGFDPGEWRKDECGAWMHRDQHDAESEFGWRALKIRPGPAEDAGSLRPFHWQNSYDIENGRAVCHVKADRAELPAGQAIAQPANSGEW